MAGYLDFLQPSAPTDSSTVDIKQFLGPVMEAMAAEARRASDPLQGIADIGGAIFGTIGSGTPYHQNLAALQGKRSQAIQGAASMFLNLLGQERQVEELKAQERRFAATHGLALKQLEETIKHRKETVDIDRQKLGLSREMEDRRLREEEARREKERVTEERKQYDENVKTAVASLPDEQKQELARRLAADRDYQNMLGSRLYADAGKRLREHYLALAPKLPKEVSQVVEGLGTLNKSMGRMRELFKETDWADRMAGPETRRRFQTVHATALNAIRALGEMGVLTPGEVPFAERFMPSPTEWGIYGRESILGGFDELDRYIGEKISRYAAKTGMSEEQIRKLAGLGPKTSAEWRGEPEIETRGTGDRGNYEIQAPPGTTYTGRKTPDGRPIYKFPDGSTRAPPRR